MTEEGRQEWRRLPGLFQRMSCILHLTGCGPVCPSSGSTCLKLSSLSGIQSVSANVYSDSLTGGRRHDTGTVHRHYTQALYTDTAQMQCTQILHKGTVYRHWTQIVHIDSGHRHCMHCTVHSLSLWLDSAMQVSHSHSHIHNGSLDQILLQWISESVNQGISASVFLIFLRFFKIFGFFDHFGQLLNFFYGFLLFFCIFFFIFFYFFFIFFYIFHLF